MNSNRGGVLHTLRALQARGLVREVEAGHWALTNEGVREAEQRMDTQLLSALRLTAAQGE